ncbi:ROK family transcriptional regulator [Promicromonospora sp. NPDC052451]|uniref:ROK family transcriptional regulator n=1 Tax=Promicromonospora sp. NPDC052451 TaxID=3364407 RepID=UPI0037C8FC04
MTKREQPQVRDLNLVRTFREVRAGSGSTTTELVRATGLSRPSINSLVAELTDLGWVVAVEPVPNGQGGRPPQRFRFHAERGRLLGVDIGVHRISAVLTDLAGTVLAGHELAVEPTAAPPRRLETLDVVVEAVLATADVTPDAVWSVAAAVTGPVDAHGRTSMVSPLPGWAEVDLVGHLGRRFTCPVQVENDVKVALLAEHEWGAVRGARDVVYILAGLRTGAAALVNGRLVRGHGGAAGEIGALPAVRWLTALDGLQGHSGMPAGLRESERSAWTFQQARQGDAEARELVWQYARDLATGAAAVVLTLDPEVVVLGGGNTPWADLWGAEFGAMLSKSVVRMPRVTVSSLGGDHVARGAVRLAMVDVERTFYTEKVLRAERPLAARA